MLCFHARRPSAPYFAVIYGYDLSRARPVLRQRMCQPPFCLMFCCATAEAGSSKFWLFHEEISWVQVWPALFLRCVGRTESKGVKPRWNVRTKWCGPVATLVDLLSTSSSSSVLLLSETERFWFEKQMDPTLPLISLPMFVQMPLQGLIPLIPFKVWYFLQ